DPAHARAGQLRRVRAAGPADAGAARAVRAAGVAAVDVRPGAAAGAGAACDRTGWVGGLFVRPLRQRPAHLPRPARDGAGGRVAVRAAVHPLIRIRVQTHATTVIPTPDSIRGRDLPFRRSLACGPG